MTMRLIANDLAPQLDLDGTWEFDTGLQQPGRITVPGCWEAQGYPKTLDGPVRYRRTFVLPAEWQGHTGVPLRTAAASAVSIPSHTPSV